VEGHVVGRGEVQEQGQVTLLEGRNIPCESEVFLPEKIAGVYREAQMAFIQEFEVRRDQHEL
jgi:hypothetical protein